MKIKDILLFCFCVLIINILVALFFYQLDKSYTNRAKAAGYYCNQCLTDSECEKYCNK